MVQKVNNQLNFIVNVDISGFLCILYIYLCKYIYSTGVSEICDFSTGPPQKSGHIIDNPNKALTHFISFLDSCQNAVKLEARINYKSHLVVKSYFNFIEYMHVKLEWLIHLINCTLNLHLKSLHSGDLSLSLVFVMIKRYYLNILMI